LQSENSLKIKYEYCFNVLPYWSEHLVAPELSDYIATKLFPLSVWSISMTPTEALCLDINWNQIREKLAREITLLEDALTQTIEPRQRVDSLITLAEYWRVREVEHTQELLFQAASLARSINYKEGLALCQVELVNYSPSESEFDEKTHLAFEAIDALKDSPPSQMLVNAHLQIAWMYFFFGDYSISMDWGLKGLEMVPQFGTPTLQARLLDLIACVHSQMNDHPTALKMHAEALALEITIGDLVNYSSVLNNYAMSYFEVGDMEHALEMSRPSVKIGNELKLTRLLQNYYDTEGEILLAMGRLDEAEAMLKGALETTCNHPLEISRGFITRTLGKVTLAAGRLEAAARYLQQSIDIMVHLNLRGELAQSYRLMAETCEQQGDFSAALAHYKNYHKLSEETMGNKTARQLTALKASYNIQLAQRDAEIERLHNIELQAQIEQQKHVQSVLEMLATTDMLTTLANRHQFFVLGEREVERSMRYNRPLALLILDIDFFKRINDTLGHIAGDQVLAAIGKLIRTEMRAADISGRYGGEEFCILLPETTAENALLLAERLCAAIADLRVPTENGAVSITASIGVSELNRPEVSVDKFAGHELAVMLNHADQALYVAKQSGRNTVRLYDKDNIPEGLQDAPLSMI
jgi:diguanylate cyclase (GGDEF)-like protein